MSIELVMLSNHLILCHLLLLLPSIFPSIRIISNQLALRIRWPKYWSFSFSISPSYEYSGLLSFIIDWFNLLAVQEILKSLLQNHFHSLEPYCSLQTTEIAIMTPILQIWTLKLREVKWNLLRLAQLGGIGVTAFNSVQSLSQVGLFATPCTVHGILHARILKRVAFSFSRGSSQPRDRTYISCIGRWILHYWATREAFFVLPPSNKISFLWGT